MSPSKPSTAFPPWTLKPDVIPMMPPLRSKRGVCSAPVALLRSAPPPHALPNLDATHPALENRHRRAPARGSINWRDCAADFRELWRERHRCSLPAVFQPVFQVLAGRGALAVAGLGKRAGIHLSNPRLV